MRIREKNSVPSYLCLSGYIIKISEHCFSRESGAKWSLWKEEQPGK